MDMVVAFDEDSTEREVLMVICSMNMPAETFAEFRECLECLAFTAADVHPHAHALVSETHLDTWCSVGQEASIFQARSRELESRSGTSCSIF